MEAEFSLGVRVRLFNWNLARAVAATGKTQGQLAAELGICAHTLSGYVSLRSYPREGLRERIAQHLGVSSDSIFPRSIAPVRLLRQPEPLPLAKVDALAWMDREALGPPAYESVERQERDRVVHLILSVLSPRERRVLDLRFGLEDGKPRTLEEVGRDFGVSRGRIHEIQQKALRKLRHPSCARLVKDFVV